MIIIIILLIFLFLVSRKEEHFCSTKQNPYFVERNRVIRLLTNKTIKEAMEITGTTSSSELLSSISRYGLIALVHQDTITGFQPIYETNSITTKRFDRLIE